MTSTTHPAGGNVSCPQIFANSDNVVQSAAEILVPSCSIVMPLVLVLSMASYLILFCRVNILSLSALSYTLSYAELNIFSGQSLEYDTE